MEDTLYDAIVIGSGTTGSFAAKELTEKGRSVLLLEAGPEISVKDTDPAKRRDPPNPINFWQRAAATLTGQPIQARAVFFFATLRHLFVNDRENPYSTPRGVPFNWIRSRQGGGRSHVFGRVLLRWSDDDFRMKSRTGKGRDWPVSYDDLTPFYEEAERTIGVYGNDDNVPTMPDSIYAGPAQVSPAEQHFKAAVESKWAGRRVTSWRYMAPEPTRVLRPMQDAMATGNLTVRYNAIARKLLTNAEGERVTGVELVDAETGETHVVKTRSVVLCASTIESVRLLLNSANDRHPTGLGNSSGTLGQYFMDQLPCTAAGQYPPVTGFVLDTSLPPDPFYSPLAGCFVPRFYDEAGQAINMCAYQGGIGRKPVGQNEAAHLEFFGYGMMLPRAENQISLNPSRVDKYGIPIAHINCRINEDDREVLRKVEGAIEELVEGTGGRLDFVSSPLGLREKGRGAYSHLNFFLRLIFRRLFFLSMRMGAAIHEVGGARMGSDPKDSVLNSWNQSWDLPNLYVTDASAFPTGGVSGATLTCMALTIRAARRLAAELEKGVAVET